MNFARQFGGALGVNLLSIQLERQTARHAQALNAMQDGGGAMREALAAIERVLALEGIADGMHQAMAQDHLAQRLLAQASMPAFRDTFLTVAIAGLLALVPVAIMRRRPAG